LMDEIGRGTSTFDGLSLAWACAVNIVTKIKALTLFATHYFELTALADQFPAIRNVHLNATEHDNGIVFLHSVEDGPANQSYGLQVAQLAGIPGTVVQQAKSKLKQLENDEFKNTASSSTQPDLFPKTAPHPAIDKLLEIDPDEMTPKQAQDFIYQLNKLVRDS